MTWTGPDEIVAQVQRLWSQGRLLACAVPFSEAGRAVCDTLLEFPLPLKLRRPSPREFGERFEGVRAWIEALETGSRSRRGMGYDIVWDETRNRELGRNKTPAGIRVPARADALAMVGKTAEAARFDAVVEATLARFPTLRDWLARKPLAVLDHADDWEQVLDCLAWFRSHPRAGLYARQIDVVGVHTKFIETRKGLLAELLDIVLPAEAIERSATGARGFEARYGLRAKPSLVRFRILDARHAIGGFTDLTVPAEHFGSLPLSIARAFVIENEITGLACPPMPDSMIVLGMGHAVSLAAARWLADLDVHYWGDLDTHGFAMLDRLRASLPRCSWTGQRC